MKITFCTEDGRASQIEVGKEATFGTMKEVLAVEFKTKPENITLSFRGDSSIPDTETVEKQGIQNNDMLLVVISAPGKKRRNQRVQPREGGPGAALEEARRNAARAIAEGNPAPTGLDLLLPPQLRGLDFGQIFAPRQQSGQVQAQRQRNAQAINDNYQLAMQESPESFASVYMLYIDVEINGVPVKAFIDSGAQSTVMSKDCAERTGVIGLVDPRFAGVAVGVGQAKIMGRVHLAPVKIAANFYNCSFSVLGQMNNMDLLIGLDMLKKYQCNIDLKNDLLHIGTTDQTVKFLPESELPSHARLTKK